MKFEDILKATQKELFSKLNTMYKGNTTICRGNYILVRGEAPIMLLAHLDTVHKSPVRTICKNADGSILMSPQGIGGDDRCGVYTLVTVYEKAKVKPWLLFTCDEEVGGVGASVFCTRFQKGKLPKKELESLKMLVEIDRKGRIDAVYYDCDNPEFEEYITSKGFETDFGSFSDISLIAPALGVAAVNLSSGYYNAHTQHEYIDRKHLNATVKKVVEIVADAAKPDFPQYEYIESYRFSRYGYGGWGDWGRGTYPLVLEDAPNLKKVPADIRNEYAALLDFYTEGELEALRKEHGDNVIRMLFESEMADYYGDMYDEEELK